MAWISLGLFCLGLHSFLICMLYLLPNWGRFHLLLLPIDSQPHCFLSVLGLWWYECWIFCYYPTDPWGSVYFFLLYFLSIVKIGWTLLFCSQSTLILPSAIFTLLLSSPKMFFICYFSVLQFPLGNFYNFYFFAEIFLFVSREFYN